MKNEDKPKEPGRGLQCEGLLKPRGRSQHKTEREQSTCGCSSQCMSQPKGNDGRGEVCTVHNPCVFNAILKIMTLQNNNEASDQNKDKLAMV